MYLTVCEEVSVLADEFNFTVLAGFYEENMTSLVEQLIALDADVIFGCGDCEDFLLECEIHGLAPMLHSCAGCFLDRLGEEARFATTAVTWLSSITTRETFLEDMTALEFYDEFTDLFDAAPTHLAAGEWGALSVLVQAIETANSTEPEAVAEVLRDIHVDTLFGEVAFDENGQASRSYLIAQLPFTGSALYWVAPLDDPGVVKAIFPAPNWLERECYTDAASLYGESGGVCSLCAIGDISVLTGQLDEYGSMRRTCQGCDIWSLRYFVSERHWCGVLLQRLRDRSVHECHRSLSVSLLPDWHLLPMRPRQRPAELVPLAARQRPLAPSPASIVRSEAIKKYPGRRAAFPATLVSSSIRLDRLRAKHASLGLPTTKRKRICVNLVPPACIRHFSTRPRAVFVILTRTTMGRERLRALLAGETWRRHLPSRRWRKSAGLGENTRSKTPPASRAPLACNVRLGPNPRWRRGTGQKW